MSSSGRSCRGPRAYGPVTDTPQTRARSEDAVDLHVRRWGGWDDIAFDPEIEAVVTRLAHLARYLDWTTAEAGREVGLARQDYRTLHALLIRDTPGFATTGDLAASSGVSNATMTDRVDRLTRLGLVLRVPSEDDRRVILVQVTDEGFARWKRAMRLRGKAEEALFAGMSPDARRRLSGLLRRLLLRAESLSEQRR